MDKINLKHLDELLEHIESFGSRPKIWEYAGIHATFDMYDDAVVVKASKHGVDSYRVTELVYGLLQQQMKSYTLNGKPITFLPFDNQDKKVA